MGPCSFQWCPMTKWKWEQIGTKKVLFEHKEKLPYSEAHRTLEKAAQIVCGVSFSGRDSKPTCMHSCATCPGWSCFSRGLGPDDLEVFSNPNHSSVILYSKCYTPVTFHSACHMPEMTTLSTITRLWYSPTPIGQVTSWSRRQNKPSKLRLTRQMQYVPTIRADHHSGPLCATGSAHMKVRAKSGDGPLTWLLFEFLRTSVFSWIK